MFSYEIRIASAVRCFQHTSLSPTQTSAHTDNAEVVIAAIVTLLPNNPYFHFITPCIDGDHRLR